MIFCAEKRKSHGGDCRPEHHSSSRWSPWASLRGNSKFGKQFPITRLLVMPDSTYGKSTHSTNGATR